MVMALEYLVLRWSFRTSHSQRVLVLRAFIDLERGMCGQSSREGYEVAVVLAVRKSGTRPDFLSVGSASAL